MKELTIYLAGKMSGLTLNEMNEWRLTIKKYLEILADYTDKDINIINPVSYFNFDNIRHQSELEVMNFDLNKVKSSDLLIVNMEGLNTSIGTCIELYEAYKQNIPVIAHGSNELFENLHPWIQICITRHEKTWVEVLNYIDNFYLK